MRLSSDPELLLVSGGRHSREEQTASPGGKGWGLDANSGSTEERMKDLAQGAWTGRKGWVVSEPCPEDLGIWQMQEGRTFQKEGTAL